MVKIVSRLIIVVALASSSRSFAVGRAPKLPLAFRCRKWARRFRYRHGGEAGKVLKLPGRWT
jgi:hypothetical protein